MATVLNSKARHYRCNSGENTSAEQCVESEGDIFIKELSHKQLRTSITLDEQLRQGRKFHSSHSYQPITEQTSGTLTYDEFKNLSRAAEHPTGKVIDSDASETGSVSRHVRELALAVKPNSTETKLLEFAIACNAVGSVKPENRPKDHPINYIRDLENELFGHLSDTCDPKKTAKTILRKRKQLIEATSDPIEIKSKPKLAESGSLWDVDELLPSSKKKLPEKIYSCQKERLYTIKNREIVCLTDDALRDPCVVDEKTINLEQSNIPAIHEGPTKISVDEIKNLRQFRNYEKGEPAETLYLKNLSLHVREEDLSTWFNEFQRPDKPQIVYNLLKTGKMRGQAFVHFHCTDAASKALEKLNGCIMHGKPLIIQFSKSRR